MTRAKNDTKPGNPPELLQLFETQNVTITGGNCTVFIFYISSNL